jgi:cation:H+ antiporter
MTSAAVLLGLGALLLWFGADRLVEGSAGLARSFGVPPLVVGLTVVAWGTSMPELVVSGFAAWNGNGGIALGNVVGSNIANLGLILGVTALVTPVPVQAGLALRELPALAATTIALPLVLLGGGISRLEGALLVAGGVGFTIWSTRRAPTILASVEAQSAGSDVTRRPDREVAAVDGADASKGDDSGRSRTVLSVWTVIGLVLLVAGGKSFVEGAVRLATAFAISDRVIGLTVVAIGTSLPELAASLVAALRGHSALAVGNVIGSNIFNVLAVCGGAALLRPMAASPGSMRGDLVALALFTLVGGWALRTARNVSRVEGAVLVAGYVGYLAILVTFG